MIGTSHHASNKHDASTSRHQVSELIRVVKPDRVILELDESRRDVLEFDDEKKLLEAKNTVNVNRKMLIKVFKHYRTKDKVILAVIFINYKEKIFLLKQKRQF